MTIFTKIFPCCCPWSDCCEPKGREFAPVMTTPKFGPTKNLTKIPPLAITTEQVATKAIEEQSLPNQVAKNDDETPRPDPQKKPPEEHFVQIQPHPQGRPKSHQADPALTDDEREALAFQYGHSTQLNTHTPVRVYIRVEQPSVPIVSAVFSKTLPAIPQKKPVERDILTMSIDQQSPVEKKSNGTVVKE